MSRKEFVLLVSRAFALLLAAWVFVDVTYLLGHLFPLFHHMSLRSALATTYDYWTIYYLTLVVFDLVRIVVLSLAAALFWKCGPRVEALFATRQDDQKPSE